MSRKSQISRSDHSSTEMPGRAITATRYRSYVFYGRSGTGKTTIAGSFPKPALLLDFKDEGTDSVIGIKGLECRSLSSLDEWETMYWWLKKNHTKFETVIIDTVSQIQQISMVELLGETRNGKPIGQWGSMTQRDFGTVSAFMSEWLMNYRDLAAEGLMNVVFIAQDRTFSGENENAQENEIDPEVGPALFPSVAKRLNASVSVIGNTFIRMKFKEVGGAKGKKKVKEEPEYCLRIGPSSAYTTKIRKDKSIVVPSFISDPSYEDILDIIKGE